VYSGTYPRDLLERVGGWRDFQMFENWDLARRLMDIRAFMRYPW